MAKLKEILSRIRFVRRPTSNITKIIVIVAIVLCMTTLIALRLSTVALEELHVGVHATGGGGAEGAGGIALGGLGGAGVVNRVVLDVLGKLFTGIQQLLELGVGNITAHDNGTGE